MGRPARISLYVTLALWGLLAASLLTRPPRNILSWDTFGYHLYLPAIFIHADPGISDVEWVERAVTTYGSTGTLYQISQLPDGRWVNKYPMGMAVLWSPFFLAGHAVAHLTHAPADGFSAPYQWALIAGALVYLFIGLMVLRRVLLHLFPEAITALVLTLIVLGTNYYHQAVFSTGMPHIFLFTLGACVLLYSIRWYASGSLRHAAMLGMLLGLTVLARPSEAVWGAVPLLIGASNWRAHMARLVAQRTGLLVMACMALVILLPQFVYWKWMTGKWLYMSYNNPGEGFEFLHPYVLEVLFSFRKGWYIYTPLMLVATAGLWYLRRAASDWFWPCVVFFVLNLYIVSSWSCWWYADSFGQRALVQSYPLMAIPLGAVIVRSREWKLPLRIAGLALLMLMIVLDLFQTAQSARGLIHTSRMTWPAYAAVFGKWEAPEGLEKLLLVERAYSNEVAFPAPNQYRGTSLVHLGFESLPDDTTARGYRDTSAYRGTGAFLLTPNRMYSPTWQRPWGELTGADHCWIGASCWVQRPLVGDIPVVALVVQLEHGGHAYGYQARVSRLDTVAPGAWQELFLWYLSPEIRRPSDPVKIYCWLQAGGGALIDEVDVHIFEPLP